MPGEWRVPLKPTSPRRYPCPIPAGPLAAAPRQIPWCWSLIENGGLALISFLSLIVYLRILSVADFGLFSTALALIELLGVLVTMLFHNALVQRSDATDLHFNTAFTATMALSLLMALGCWAMAPIFAAWVHQPSAARVLVWMGLIFPCSAVSATLVAQQRRQFAFRTLALRSLIGRVIGGGIGIAAAFMGAGLWSLVLQQILIAAIGSFVLWVSSDRTPRLQFRYGEFKQMIGFGMFSVSSLFLSISIKRVFTILATSFLGVEAAGYLNLSFRVVDVLWATAATAVTQVALPLLAGLQFDTARLKRAYQASTQFSCLAIYPCFVGLGAVAPDIVEVLFGHRWQPSSPYLASSRLSGSRAGAATAIYAPVDGAWQAPRFPAGVDCGTALHAGHYRLVSGCLRCPGPWPSG